MHTEPAEKNTYYDTVIIGCGSFTAFFLSFLNDARLNGSKILAVERLPRPFKKLLASGNGRCNYSNKVIHESAYRSLKPVHSFTTAFFKKIRAFNLENYFKARGILSREDEYGRLFPFTNSAKTITDFFNSQLIRSKVTVLFSTLLTAATYEKKKQRFRITLKNLLTNQTSAIFSRHLIFASGGAAHPQLGTDGSTFDVISSLGHSIAGPTPGICGLRTSKTPFSRLAGLKLEARLKYGRFERTGEILFTEYGISGPNALYLSNHVSSDLFHGRKVVIELDFLPVPGLTASYFISLMEKQTGLTIQETFGGVLNRDFLRAFLSHTEPASEYASRSSISATYKNLRNYPLEITGLLSFKEAQVSLGGVCVDEVEPDTLESKLIKNLFFGGEVLDYTGDCGGYNIHMAAVSARTVFDSLLPRLAS